MATLSVDEAALARTRTPSPSKDPDAGLRTLDHYQRRLPRWSYRLREALIPMVRQETPILAAIQESCRTPFLDSYFAFTANLGTHTFFMTALPICFWCGYSEVGVAMVHMLALGVYLSGILKDALCLPRPLSPPLKRITMSGSAALEYGFPSTHTTNAISVALYASWEMSAMRDSVSTSTYVLAQTALVWYVLSIMLGRMYCGMHGFFDVAVGIALGAFITWIRVAFGPAFDAWVLSASWSRPVICTVMIALAVRFHPEPADDCPCFDDSVAFSGVVMGLELGLWHFATLKHEEHITIRSLDNLHNYDNSNKFKMLGRLVLGVVMIFLWRAVVKRVLLRTLPPVYRFVDQFGFRLPRRYFKQSRDYKQVPKLRDDDQVLPSASQIPGMISNIRYPRKRTVSIGPQSAADVREQIAHREERRRSSKPESIALPKKPSLRSLQSSALMTPTPSAEEAILKTPTIQEDGGETSYLSSRPLPQSTASSRLQTQQYTGSLLTPPASDHASDGTSEDERQNDRKMFEQLEKPRVRYDVEVITKLVVYAGIAWLAVEVNPAIFEGLGMV